MRTTYHCHLSQSLIKTLDKLTRIPLIYSHDYILLIIIPQESTSHNRKNIGRLRFYHTAWVLWCNFTVTIRH